MRHLKGKRILITGAARGIGLETALEFARHGAVIIASDMNREALDEAAKRIADAGAVVHTHQLDVTDNAAITRLRDQLHADDLKVDVLVNNAGVVFGGPFLDVSLDKHLLTYRVNIEAVVAMTHAFLPDMLERGAGHVVNIASASGFVGLPYGSTYASSKWSVIGFSESIRLEMQQLGHEVGATAVCPSYVGTGMFAGVKPPTGTKLLSPPRLARRIVAAVERNQPFVIAPPLVYLAPMLRGLVPLALYDVIGRVFGTTTSMQSWRGHSS